MVNFFLQDFKNAINALRIGRNFLLDVLKTMFTSRFLDEKMEEFYKNGDLKRNLFLGKGQEAGGAVIAHLMKKDDNLFPHYRGYSHVIGKGLPLEKIILEILEKRMGVAEGKGGSGKFIYPELNIFSYTSIIGQNFGTAVGMAWAAKYKKEEKMTVIFFGEGATMRGSFYTALNISAVLSVPILFVCENNQYCFTKKFSESSRTNLVKKVKAFGIKYTIVDGNNPLDIYFTTRKLMDYVKTTQMPAFLELYSYRIAGHYMDDDAHYQNRKELEMWIKRNPIEMLSKILIMSGLASRTEIHSMAEETKNDIDRLTNLAKLEREIDFSDLEKEIYA